MSATDTSPDAPERDPEVERAARRAAASFLARRPIGARRRRPVESLAVAIPVDARTKAGRITTDLRDALLRQLGRPPSATERAIIAQIVQLKLRLLSYDDLFLAAGGDVSVHDARQYHAYSTSYVRALRLLGLRGAPEPTMSLRDALAAGAPRMPPGAPAAPGAAITPPGAEAPPGRDLASPTPGSAP